MAGKELGGSLRTIVSAPKIVSHVYTLRPVHSFTQFLTLFSSSILFLWGRAYCETCDNGHVMQLSGKCVLVDIFLV